MQRKRLFLLVATLLTTFILFGLLIVALPPEIPFLPLGGISTTLLFFLLLFFLVLIVLQCFKVILSRSTLWGIFVVLIFFLLKEKLSHPLFFILLFALSYFIDAMIRTQRKTS